MQNVRLLAFLDHESRHTRQFKGFSPELTDGEDHREGLLHPRFLVIETTPDGIFLLRCTKDGTVVGDTWHFNVEEAWRQAEAEYGVDLTHWETVPDSIDDPVTYAPNKLTESSSGT